MNFNERDEFMKYSRETAEALNKQIQDSINIIKTTSNPDTFFYRYSFLIQRLKDLSEVMKYVDYTGDHPTVLIKQLQENKTNFFSEFIHTYYDETYLKLQSLKTNKAKLNNANKFYEILTNDYSDYLEKENIEIVNKLYKQLKEDFHL